MARTFLQLVQQACGEIGIPQPQYLFGSQNDSETQLIALANREGNEFSNCANKNGGWQQLRINYTFPTVANIDNYPLPDDLDYFVDRTFWNNAYKWELIGPITAQERQILTYGVVASGPRPKFYIQQNRFYLNPTPTTVQTIAFQYYSSYWCQSQTGVKQKTWMADTDVYLLDEDCFIQGLKYRFLRAKGFDYTEEFNAYEMDKQRAIARSGGSPDLPLASRGPRPIFISDANIPDTGYG